MSYYPRPLRRAGVVCYQAETKREEARDEHEREDLRGSRIG